MNAESPAEGYWSNSFYSICNTQRTPWPELCAHNDLSVISYHKLLSHYKQRAAHQQVWRNRHYGNTMVITACQNNAYDVYYYKEICHTTASVETPSPKHQQIKLEYHCHSFVSFVTTFRDGRFQFFFFFGNDIIYETKGDMEWWSY